MDPGTHRRRWPLWLLALVIFVLVSAYGGHESYAFIEGKAFCGEVCHSVMHPEYEVHASSPHARVDCIKCHAGPGIEHKVRAKIRGLHQVKAIVTGDFEIPLKVSLPHLRPASEICTQCHWPDKFAGTTVQDHVYFLPDEENSAHFIKLMLPVGGGPLEVGSEAAKIDRPSIHWHISDKSSVYYVATDPERQDIAWVKLSDAAGREAIYRREGSDISEADLLTQHDVRRMDCIDCHNRSVHVFQPPQRLLNQAMLAGDIDPSLPYVKREGLRLLAAEYPSRDAARTAIQAAVRDFYATEYPDVATTRSAAVERAGVVIGELYAANVFPEMKADWRAHPNNVGHTFSRGCFRCHDGQMKDERGVAISSSCNTCHDIAAQGAGLRPTSLTGPLEFEHPEFIDDLWKESACTDCHTGAGTDL